VRVEVPLHASNVMPIDPETGQATRKRIAGEAKKG
jgi:ribosomal protein L24